MGLDSIGTVNGEAVRVFLVAAHCELRESLCLLLESEGMTLSGWSVNCDTRVRSMPVATDVVVVALPELSRRRLHTIRGLADLPDAPPCVVLAVNDDLGSLGQAFAAGAEGYVAARKAWQTLPRTLREVVTARAARPSSGRP